MKATLLLLFLLAAMLLSGCKQDYSGVPLLQDCAASCDGVAKTQRADCISACVQRSR